MAELRELIEKYALENALKHKGSPNAYSVMKKLLGEHGELRQQARDISPLIRQVLADMEAIGPEEWKRKAEVLAPELAINASKKMERHKGLPDLKNVEGEVVMRFAPNPNGPPTIGSARGIIINSEYVNMYGGKFILRFDDTDPSEEKQPLLNAYAWYVEDCEWLGAKPDQIITASERIDLYYSVAKELILAGGAYVCLCDKGTFKIYRDKGVPCSHRNQLPEDNLDLWNMMLDGQLKEGEAVLRIKTDLSNPSRALRDWPAARSVETPHPLVGRRYNVWPMLDFESAIEDHLLGITHIVRGKDLADSEKRQIYLYNHMGWDYPEVSHWGIIKDLGWTKPKVVCKKKNGKIKCYKQFGSFRTSMLRKAINMNEYTGWDDPRVPTIRVLRSRGIRPEAIRKVFIELGVAETDICLNMDSIYAENRRLIDTEANRYFFVWDPIELEIEGDVPELANAPMHPSMDRGFREILAGRKIFICKRDLNLLELGDKIRLKYLCNIELIKKKTKTAKARYIGTDVDTSLRVIHWVPKNGIPIMVLKPDGIDKGLGESGIEGELGNVVQFERYGFVRINELGNPIKVYYGHR